MKKKLLKYNIILFINLIYIMSDRFYQAKYLKYKKKYLDLKMTGGGNKCLEQGKKSRFGGLYCGDADEKYCEANKYSYIEETKRCDVPNEENCARTLMKYNSVDKRCITVEEENCKPLLRSRGTDIKEKENTVICKQCGMSYNSKTNKCFDPNIKVCDKNQMEYSKFGFSIDNEYAPNPIRIKNVNSSCINQKNTNMTKFCRFKDKINEENSSNQYNDKLLNEGNNKYIYLEGNMCAPANDKNCEEINEKYDQNTQTCITTVDYNKKYPN